MASIHNHGAIHGFDGCYSAIHSFGFYFYHRK
jgi:hypothetical protein